MRKDFFGIAATMLLVGTMTFTSCSDDCVFGYDEEWDDMIPRTKQIITTDPDVSNKNYIMIGEGECAVVAIAQARKQLKYFGNNMYVEESDYYDIIAHIQQQEQCSMADYQYDLYNDGSYGVTRTESQWKSIFGCDEAIQKSNFDFGTETIRSISWYGERIYLGKSHVDYIKKYIPASGGQPAKFLNGSGDRVDVSEYNVVYK